MTTGTIVIKPITAKLTRDTDTFSRMDPYVKVTFGTRIATTAVAKKGGKNPNWTDELTIRRSNNEDIIKIEVWDKDKHTKDDLVGATSLSFGTVEAKKNKINDWVEVAYKGKSAGKILLDIQFYPDADNIKKEQANTQTNNTTITPTTGFSPMPGYMPPFANNMMPQTGMPTMPHPMQMQPQYQQQQHHQQNQQQPYIQPHQQAYPSFDQQFMQPNHIYQPGQFPTLPQQQGYGHPGYMPMQPQLQPQAVPNNGHQMKH